MRLKSGWGARCREAGQHLDCQQLLGKAISTPSFPNEAVIVKVYPEFFDFTSRTSHHLNTKHRNCRKSRYWIVSKALLSLLCLLLLLLFFSWEKKNLCFFRGFSSLNKMGVGILCTIHRTNLDLLAVEGLGGILITGFDSLFLYPR